MSDKVIPKLGKPHPELTESSTVADVEAKLKAQQEAEDSTVINDIERALDNAPSMVAAPIDYHVAYQVQSVGMPTTRDIIVTLNEPINGRNYMNLKNQIAQQAGFNDGNIIVITNVTRL